MEAVEVKVDRKNRKLTPISKQKQNFTTMINENRYK